jgi:hypothetical protein
MLYLWWQRMAYCGMSHQPGEQRVLIYSLGRSTSLAHYNLLDHIVIVMAVHGMWDVQAK